MNFAIKIKLKSHVLATLKCFYHCSVLFLLLNFETFNGKVTSFELQSGCLKVAVIFSTYILNVIYTRRLKCGKGYREIQK